MGGSGSHTHVANATGKPIRVYYSVETMVLSEMVMEVTGGMEVSAGAASSVGGKISGSTSTKMVFKPDTRVRYIRIPNRDFSKFSGEGVLFASVFVENPSKSGECLDTICSNFRVPDDKSFIVTKNHNIHFQKHGADLWEDEQGNKH